MTDANPEFNPEFNQDVIQEDTGRCIRCGGTMVAERMRNGGTREIIWEWSCLNCGMTRYQELGTPPDQSRKGRTRSGITRKG